MADIESAEDFWVRLRVSTPVILTGGTEHALVARIRARDAAIRAAAIEECARVCEKRRDGAWATHYHNRPGANAVIMRALHNEANCCAVAIRALKEKP